jgi:hypothetical protein
MQIIDISNIMEQKGAAAALKKLRVLCLYGYNNNIECFKLMTQEFRARFEHVADFIFIEAPHALNPA